MSGLKFDEFYFVPKEIKAIRITEENQQQIADYLGVKIATMRGKPFINTLGEEGYVEEWFVDSPLDLREFYTDEEFQKIFKPKVARDKYIETERSKAIEVALYKLLHAQATALLHSNNETGDIELMAKKTAVEISKLF